MPFFNGRHDQVQLYSETLDTLQCAIVSVSGPFAIVVDMNAPLPCHDALSRHWYRRHPFNTHNYLLHDFLSHTELIVSNFMFAQNCGYTYFNVNTKSYIDHVFIPEYFANCVNGCHIMSNMENNTSDHHPMSLWVQVNVNNQGEVTASKVPSHPRMNWSNSHACDIYTQYMCM